MSDIRKENYNLKQYLHEIVQKPIDYIEILTSWSEEDYDMFNSFLDELKKPCDASVSTREKGNRLENLIAFLVKKTYFYSVYQNVTTGTNEIDEVIVLSPQGRQALSSFGISEDLLELGTDIILGECKNYNSALSVTYVGKFYSLMIATDVTFGIIFTQKGLTGNESEYHDAYGLTKVLRIIEKYRNNRELYILTFTLEDYEKINRRECTFFQLIKAKKLELQLSSHYSQFLHEYHHDSEDKIRQIVQSIHS